MGSTVIDIKYVKRCAFCKHWYDPTNSAISPKSPTIGLWEIKDVNQKCKCLKRNIPMAAAAFCSWGFESKM